jgi:hypothetical protein
MHYAIAATPLLFAMACAVDETAQESTSDTTDSVTAASEPSPGPTSPPRAQTVMTTGPAVSFSPPACQVFAGPNRGLKICGTVEVDLFRSNGLEEIFVVGTDFAVWHAWQTSATTWHGWQTLGGQVFCRDFPPCDEFDGVAMPLVSDAPVIAVLGTDGREWCRAWPWSSGWHVCNPL